MLDYYTVSEYSAVTGKDSGNIRRLLIQGRISGEKMGNQWIIPKGTIYPDKRVKSGNYLSWRKKNNLNKRNSKLLKALTKMCREFYEIYGSTMEKVILYGSYARGEETKESDVDIAVLLKTGHTEEMHDRMIDIVVEYELELGVTLSVVPIEYEEYKQWHRTLPFYRNIDKEGIQLWKIV